MYATAAHMVIAPYEVQSSETRGLPHGVRRDGRSGCAAPGNDLDHARLICTATLGRPTVAEAERVKAVLETKRFKMKFRSFADLV